jgi:hypothetical protein
MADQLELKKMKMEYKRVDAAKEELEFKIEERLVEITRLKEHIVIQDAKLQELAQKIKDFI